jgi:hypothetical protein
MRKPLRSVLGTSSRHPRAVVAAYGPHPNRATKLVVSIVERGSDEPSATRTWTVQEGDARTDPIIGDEVTGFLRQHRVKDTAVTDRVIGCPHQEGIDYPLGRTCPQCPAWTGIDRFTHLPLEIPAPTMSPGEILKVLSAEPPMAPREALTSADGLRHALVEPLLEAIERGLGDPEGASEGEAALLCYALYLLAKWREPRAYPYVIRWLSLPGDGAYEIAGDIVTEDGGRILAAVCDGNLEPINQLILDADADQFCRGVAVRALGLLAAWAEVPREQIVDYFEWLAREGLERKGSQVWNSLASVSADIEAVPAFPALRRAFDEGLIHPMYIDRSELDVAEGAHGELLEHTRDRYYPIDDVAEATQWWASPKSQGVFDRAGTYYAPPKVGRNDPCPCGSGKKYKKCCGA